jgi:hypothetical protein
MREKLLATLLVGLVLGLVVSPFVRQAEVQGQPEGKVPAAAWEYKVVEFGTGVQNTETDEDMTKKLNELAKNGWEYAGPLASAHVDDKRFLQGYVAFKRLKK